MLRIEISCAMCGKGREITVEQAGLDAATPISALVGGHGWLVEQNGRHLDLYCSKRCSSGQDHQREFGRMWSQAE